MLHAFDISGNHQRLDGGAMFGNAPRAMWSRWCPPDEQGRIELSCRALLIQTDQKRILFETGIGVFFPPDLKERYGVVESDHVLLSSLSALGLTDADIDVVMLSHLHFDHAGGLLAAFTPNEAARLLFPKAQFVVGSEAFARAKAPHARDRASFITELPALLEQSGRLHLIDAQTNTTALFGTDRISFFASSGHTPGMLNAVITGQAQSVVFCADLIPGVPWVHLPITMGYDRFAEHLIDEKTELFSRSDLSRTWFFFTHDTNVVMAKVKKDDKGRYQAYDAQPHRAAGWDLDAPIGS